MFNLVGTVAPRELPRAVEERRCEVVWRLFEGKRRRRARSTRKRRSKVRSIGFWYWKTALITLQANGHHFLQRRLMKISRSISVAKRNWIECQMNYSSLFYLLSHTLSLIPIAFAFSFSLSYYLSLSLPLFLQWNLRYCEFRVRGGVWNLDLIEPRVSMLSAELVGVAGSVTESGSWLWKERGPWCMLPEWCRPPAICVPITGWRPLTRCGELAKEISRLFVKHSKPH